MFLAAAGCGGDGDGTGDGADAGGMSVDAGDGAGGRADGGVPDAGDGVGDDRQGAQDAGGPAVGGQDAGDQDAGTPLAPPRMVVDDGITPDMAFLPDMDGDLTRPVGAIVDEDIKAHFVLGELLISTDSSEALADLVSAWGGEVIETIELPDLPDLHVVRIAPEAADMDELAANMETLDAYGSEEVRFSAQAGLDLFAAAAKAGAQDQAVVSLNWITDPAGIGEGTTTDAATGPADYTPDAFEWPYFTTGSAQNSGVTSAWQTLSVLDRLSPRSRPRVLVIDGGFVELADYPDGTRRTGAAWSTPNGSSCSGSPCPWHGTKVAATAAGRVDNGLGVAGSGGPVAALDVLQFGGFDIRGFARLFGELLLAPLGGGPVAVNISGSVEVPGVLNVGLNVLLDPILDAAFRDADLLVVAAAGNEDLDVDKKARFLRRNLPWERSSVIPCESSSVICVGGMDWDSTDKASGSNYGSDAENDSVDIYGPYDVWVPEVTADGTVTGDIIRRGGTSYSAPFVSGVIALIHAARPGISAAAAVNCLLRSAHTDVDVHGAGGNQRRVNAFGAVACAGRLSFPLLRLVSPLAPESVMGGTDVEMRADSMGSEGLALPVTWTSDLDGRIVTVGSGVPFQWDELSVGTHVLTATVTDPNGDTATATVDVTVLNNAPTVTIASPSNGARFGVMQSIRLQGVSSDVDERPTGRLPDSQVSWRIPGTSFTGTGHSATIPAGQLATGNYTVIFEGDDGLASASDSIDITVAPCTGTCPTANITTPAGDTIVRTSLSDGSADVSFEGVASDAEDGTLGGDKMFWRLTNASGNRSTICAPLSIGGATVRCERFTQKLTDTEFDLDGTDYFITLEVTDSDGNTATDSVKVTILYQLM